MLGPEDTQKKKGTFLPTHLVAASVVKTEKSETTSHGRGGG